MYLFNLVGDRRKLLEREGGRLREIGRVLGEGVEKEGNERGLGENGEERERKKETGGNNQSNIQ